MFSSAVLFAVSRVHSREPRRCTAAGIRDNEKRFTLPLSLSLSLFLSRVLVSHPLSKLPIVRGEAISIQMELLDYDIPREFSEL